METNQYTTGNQKQADVLCSLYGNTRSSAHVSSHIRQLGLVTPHRLLAMCHSGQERGH